MKKYLREAGYRFTAINDLQDKQFTLLTADFVFSNNSVLNGVVMDRVETYLLFLKDFEASTFKTKLESIINSASTDNVNVGEESTISAEVVENGYNITLVFSIKG